MQVPTIATECHAPAANDIETPIVIEPSPAVCSKDIDIVFDSQDELANDPEGIDNERVTPIANKKRSRTPENDSLNNQQQRSKNKLPQVHQHQTMNINSKQQLEQTNGCINPPQEFL